MGFTWILQLYSYDNDFYGYTYIKMMCRKNIFNKIIIYLLPYLKNEIVHK